MVDKKVKTEMVEVPNVKAEQLSDPAANYNYCVEQDLYQRESDTQDR
jgi:hypothetical protein